ncbi:MAG: site-specific integrase [Hydrogenophilales bacterium]|nr:site-specific integrase [Hydrogenophilales bacterium]
MPKLSKKLVENEQPGTDQRFVWDTELKGFGVKIFPTGVKTFVFQYRSPEGKSKRFTIGKLSDSLTVEQARQIAKDRHRDVLNGRDPQGEKQARRQAPTLAQVFEDYLASDAFKEKAESTRGVDTGRINHHLRPLLGTVFADKLTTNEVKKAHRAINEGKTATTVKTKARGLARVGGGEGTAKKAVTLLRTICKWSTKDGTPAGAAVDWSNIKMARDGMREAIIEDADAYGRLFRTLDTMQNEKRIRDAVADAIRFIALTGTRRSEVTGLRWSYVDLKAGQVVLPPQAHKTGHRSGKPKTIALPAQAQVILARQPQGKPDEYVFRPSKGIGPLALSKPWRQVREEAGLPDDIGLHGLRHSVGSHLAMSGASLVEVMAQLGHSDPKTSLRYVHYAEAARSTLAERAAAVAVAGLEGKTESAEVVPLRRRK